MADNLGDTNFKRRASAISESNINQGVISGNFSIFKSVELLAQSSSNIFKEDISGSSSKFLCPGEEFEGECNSTNPCSPEGDISNKETPGTKYLLRDFLSEPLFQSTPNTSLSSQDSGIGHDLSAFKKRPLPYIDDENVYHTRFCSPFIDSGILSSSGDWTFNSIYRSSFMFSSFPATPIRLHSTPKGFSWSPPCHFNSLLNQTSPVQVSGI